MCFAVLSVSAAGSQAGIEQPLLHRDAGFRLPPLAEVGPDLGPLVMPETAEEAAGPVIGAVGRAATAGRDDAEHAEAIEEAVVMFPVVADVGSQGGKPVAGMGLADHGVKFHVIGLGPAVNDSGQGQVAANVNHLRNLGITTIFSA